MPIYTWEDKKSKKKVDVIRSFAEYENPPTEEEAPDIEDPDWERCIGDNLAVVRGNGWGAGKGFWTIPLLLGISSMFFNSCTSRETILIKAERFCRDKGGVEYLCLPPFYLTTDTGVQCKNGNRSINFIYYIYPGE